MRHFRTFLLFGALVLPRAPRAQTPAPAEAAAAADTVFGDEELASYFASGPLKQAAAALRRPEAPRIKAAGLSALVWADPLLSAAVKAAACGLVHVAAAGARGDAAPGDVARAAVGLGADHAVGLRAGKALAALSALGLVDAALGRKEQALQEGRRAAELLPLDKDSINGIAVVEYLALIAAWVGEKDLAFEQLERAVRLPNTLSYGQLKLLPYWDPLRGDPRFEKIVASFAPKE